MGLMQLMPETARRLAVADPYDPSQNVVGGTAYLRQLLDQFDENLQLALAAYNAGPNAVLKYDGVPPYAETVAYVERILRLYEGREVAVRPVVRTRPVSLARDASGKLVMTTAPR
jgi:soluble lytic murein transglycosylase-like protein